MTDAPATDAPPTPSLSEEFPSLLELRCTGTRLVYGFERVCDYFFAARIVLAPGGHSIDIIRCKERDCRLFNRFELRDGRIVSHTLHPTRVWR